MNFGTQKSYGNRLGIQASQLISRDTKVNHSNGLENVSENLNRFLQGHFRKNVNQNAKKFQLSEYFNKDFKAKSYSTHHYLCGPLNTNRVTRKIISGNFDNDYTTQPLSIAELYNNTKQTSSTKPPWIEPRKPINTPDIEREQKPPETKAKSSFNFNPRLDENFSNDKVSFVADNETVSHDGEVPDPIHQDLKDCPLYDSNEYKECPSPVYEKNTSDDENQEPDISRYNFFVGSSEKLPDNTLNDRSDRRNDTTVIKTILCKPRPREEVFEPLLTSSQD